MEEFTIYCTEEQTKKALELCAPLNFVEEGRATWKQKHSSLYIPEKWRYFSYPTAEQMINWMEERGGISVNVQRIMIGGSYKYMCHVTDLHFNYIGKGGIHYSTRKEATLAAIDIVLDYLINN